MGDDPEPESGVSQATPDDEEPDLTTEGERSTADEEGNVATDDERTAATDDERSSEEDDEGDDGRVADERTDGAGVDAAAPEPDDTDGGTEETDEESANADDGNVATDVERLDPDVIPIIEPAAEYGTGRTSAGRIDIESETTVDDADVVDTVAESSAMDPELVAEEADSVGEKIERIDEEGDSIDEGLFGSREGPEEDEEMPLADHIEEMIKRLAVVFVVAGSVSLVTFPFADQIITFLWYSVLPGGEVAQPRVYGPLEFLLARIKVASLAGLIVALPVVVYETYAFMKPGLYRNERKYYLAAIPTSLVLAVIGVAFAYFIVLPAIFTYFLAYSEAAGEIAFGLQRTFGLMLILMAYLAIVFQIPLFIMLAIMMGLTTRDWLADKRLYFWGAFLGVAFLSSPDPTGMAPIIIALTMVGLYEGTLFILKWVGR